MMPLKLFITRTHWISFRMVLLTDCIGNYDLDIKWHATQWSIPLLIKKGGSI